MCLKANVSAYVSQYNCLLEDGLMLIQHMVCICLLFLIFSMCVYMHSFLFLIKCGRYFPPLLISKDCLLPLFQKVLFLLCFFSGELSVNILHLIKSLSSWRWPSPRPGDSCWDWGGMGGHGSNSIPSSSCSKSDPRHDDALLLFLQLMQWM